jgi:hypothetical protein
MKKNHFAAILILIALTAFRSQQFEPIDVAESTLKVGGLSEEVFYYGFAEGDQVFFDFEELNGKELKEIEIIELPSSVNFMDYNSKKIENKSISITKTGIYKFRFYNSAIGGRVCKFKIRRLPASETTAKFNTAVYWKTVQDTVYTPTLERYLVKSDTTAQEVYSSNTQVSSTNAINGNKNTVVLDFIIPENTIAWSFYIATGNKGKEEYEKTKTTFTQSASAAVSQIPGYGPLAAMALTGVSYFSKVQGEDNVKYWFLDAPNAVLFNSGSNFTYYKHGDVISEASQMRNPLKGKVHLALLNDNIMDPISVTVRAAAIQVVQKWDTRIIQVMSIKNRQEPYLMN